MQNKSIDLFSFFFAKNELQIICVVLAAKVGIVNGEKKKDRKKKWVPAHAENDSIRWKSEFSLVSYRYVFPVPHYSAMDAISIQTKPIFNEWM